MDELNKLLSRLPEKLKYKDGDEIVECGLTFFFRKHSSRYQWTAGYYCMEMDYFLMCGYGNTIIEAAQHLERLVKEYLRRRGEGLCPAIMILIIILIGNSKIT